MQRNANLAPAVAVPNLVAPCYCGQGRNSNPFFPALRLNADFFPMALGGNGESLAEGLGLQVEGFVTAVKTFIDTTPAQTVSSTLLNFRGGGTFRYVFWDSPTAPDAQLNAGISFFSFPLQSGAFPGVAYTSPYIGISGHIPLGMEELALVAGGSLMPKVGASGDSKAMLGTQVSGSGYNIDGGLRLAFDRYEINALVRYEGYNINYTGETKFDPQVVQNQFTEARLKDALLQIIITAGIVF